MMTIRRNTERGYAEHGWLKSFHTLSFAGYYDPKHMGFRSLRVINEDEIEGGTGFPTHPHRDMEIVTYMIEGELAHRDSMGSQEVIRRGEVQYMCAGTGVTHSEFNASHDHKARLLQIWILPEQAGFKPSYGQKSFLDEFKTGKLTRVLSKDGADGSVKVHQDMSLWVGWLTPQRLELPVTISRHGWLQIVKGEVKLNGETLRAGDACAISLEDKPTLEVVTQSELLFFDLA